MVIKRKSTANFHLRWIFSSYSIVCDFFVKDTTLTLCGVFTAGMCILSMLSIPLPVGVPLTLQVFAVSLCGYILGVLHGTAAVTVYIALGAAGLPVFSGMRGGAHMLVGATGGFLWGFLLLALLCGIGAGGTLAKRVAYGISGAVVCHLFGVLQYAAVTGTELWQSFVFASAGFLIKDIMLVCVSAFLSERLKKYLK